MWSPKPDGRGPAALPGRVTGAALSRIAFAATGCTVFAAALVASASSSPVSAQPQGPVDDDLIELMVRPGDSCASIARRLYGDGRRYDRIHAHNDDLGPLPHHLSPGTVLRVPRPASAAPDASLVRTVNRVEARPAGTSRFAPARPGLALFRGAEVATAAASAAEIAFRDHDSLQMRENTLVVVYGHRRDQARMRTGRAYLERGALRGRLAELAGGRRWSIDTPTSRTNFQQGDAVIQVQTDGTSRIANHGAQAALVASRAVDDDELETGGSTIPPHGSQVLRLPSGMGTLVRAGEAPTAPRPLPEAPRFRATTALRVVGLTGHGASVHLAFLPVERASRYRIELSRDPDGNDLLVSAEVSAAIHETTIHRIPPGTYYASLATIDRDFFESRPSPRRAVYVLEARVVVPGGDSPEVLPYDPGDPSLPFAPPRVLPGTWIVAPPGLRCGTDERPTQLSTVRGEGRRQVTCVDARSQPVDGFVLDVVGVEARVLPPNRVLNRRREETLRLTLDAESRLPERLILEGPGLPPTALIRQSGRVYRATVFMGVETPDTLPLVVSLPVGAERLAVASLEVAVQDVGGHASSSPAVDDRAEPGVPDERRVRLDGLAPPMGPGWLSLDEPVIGPSIGAQWRLRGAVPSSADDGLRTSGVLRAGLPIFGFMVSAALPFAIGPGAAEPDGGTPATDTAAAQGRTGEGDPFAAVAVPLHLGAATEVGFHIASWIKSGVGVPHISRSLIVPSFSLSHVIELDSDRDRRDHDGFDFRLRLRQGAEWAPAQVSAGGRWVSSYGIDCGVPWARVGFEAALAMGGDLGREVRSLLVGLVGALRIGDVHLGGGIAHGPWIEGPVAMRSWVGSLSLTIEAGHTSPLD